MMFRDAVIQKRQVRTQGDGHIECLRKIIRFSYALTLVSTGSARPPETENVFHRRLRNTMFRDTFSINPMPLMQGDDHIECLPTIRTNVIVRFDAVAMRKHKDPMYVLLDWCCRRRVLSRRWTHRRS